jgi:hypothetical protein
MADLTYEILSNREDYPDDQQIQLQNGRVITVKELRDSLQPRAEFTRASEAWSRREREYQQALEGANQQLQAALAQREAAVAAGQQPAVVAPSGSVTEEDLMRDPYMGAHFRRIFEAQKMAEQKLEALESRSKLHEDTWMRNHFQGQLARLSSTHNQTFNPDGKGKGFDQGDFLEWVQKNPISRNGQVDLDLCYEQYTREDQRTHLQKEAEKRGYEKGLREGRVPMVPFGRRRQAPRDPGLPETFQELTDEKIEADPEIQAAMRGDTE